MQNIRHADRAAAPEAENPPKPAPPAKPGVYLYRGTEVTYHPILNELRPGENDYTGLTHPEMLQALGELVAAGEMRKA